MNLRTIDNIDVRGKYVLLRDDFNVQIVDGHITDAFRIEQSMPTINKLRAAGARVAIVAHRGRPKGVRDMAYTLQPIADYMGVNLIADCLDKDFLADMHDGDLVLLENVRFYAGEEKNDPAFAADLARGYDLFVNDAFAVSHRAHASTVGVAEILPASEIHHLSDVMENPQRPLLSIVAGSKVSTKIGVLKALAKLSDTLIIGGALGTTFNYAMGGRVGNSLYEADQKDTALEILDFAKQNNCRVLLPLDKGVAKEFARDAVRSNKDFTEISLMQESRRPNVTWRKFARHVPLFGMVRLVWRNGCRRGRMVHLHWRMQSQNKHVPENWTVLSVVGIPSPH